MKPTDTSIIEVAHIQLTPKEGTTKARGTIRLPDGKYVDLEISQSFMQDSKLHGIEHVPEAWKHAVRLRFFAAWHNLTEAPLLEQSEALAAGEKLRFDRLMNGVELEEGTGI